MFKLLLIAFDKEITVHRNRTTIHTIAHRMIARCIPPTAFPNSVEINAITSEVLCIPNVACCLNEFTLECICRSVYEILWIIMCKVDWPFTQSFAVIICNELLIWCIYFTQRMCPIKIFSFDQFDKRLDMIRFKPIIII